MKKYQFLYSATLTHDISVFRVWLTHDSYSVIKGVFTQDFLVYIEGLVYTRFCFIHGSVCTRFWCIQHLVYTEFWCIQALVYTGFLLWLFRVRFTQDYVVFMVVFTKEFGELRLHFTQDICVFKVLFTQNFRTRVHVFFTVQINFMSLIPLLLHLLLYIFE
jgi:hypothetical protein